MKPGKQETAGKRRHEPQPPKKPSRDTQVKRQRMISRIINLFDGPVDLSQRHDEYLYAK